MKESTKKIITLVGLFVLLNAVMALKYFQAQHAVAGFPDDSVVGRGTPVLLELGSYSCRPCRKMLPFLNTLRTEQDAFVVGYIDVSAHKAKGSHYEVQATPTQIFFDGEGNELFRHVGFYSKEEILKKWQELGIK